MNQILGINEIKKHRLSHKLLYVLLLLVTVVCVISPIKNWKQGLETVICRSINDGVYEKFGWCSKQENKLFLVNTNSRKKLNGRFLHITDMHPDSLYQLGTSIRKVCHQDEPANNLDNATRFGVAMSGCDSSMDLINFTLKWISENLADKIDFIIWTGDNIRHDNDRRVPRTERQIFDLNSKMANKLYKMFKVVNSLDPMEFDVQIIPSLGNNDVFPHNMFSLGPTLQTRELYNIWSHFIPQEQQRTFNRVTSFFVEVIPGKLGVISLNTLYFYKANPLVDNCNSKKQPGYQLLIWLGYVLEELRQRGMKCWLSGHVPPLSKNFDKSCYSKFTLWTHEYRDVIIGGIYGHMNIDHFIPIDTKLAREYLEVMISSESEQLQYYGENHTDFNFEEFHIMGAKPVNKDRYMESVRETYYDAIVSRLKKMGGKESLMSSDSLMERYNIVNVAASIIPTFNPGFRVWEYNITGIEDEIETSSLKSWNNFFQDLEIKLNEELEDGNDYSIIFKKKNKKHHDKTIPKKKPKHLPAGPGFSSQSLSPVRFVQYYADLKTIEKDYQQALKDGNTPDIAGKMAFKYQIEYTSDSSPYKMNSLLTKDYIDLSIDLSKNKSIWQTYLQRAYVSSGYHD